MYIKSILKYMSFDNAHCTILGKIWTISKPEGDESILDFFSQDSDLEFKYRYYPTNMSLKI